MPGEKIDMEDFEFSRIADHFLNAPIEEVEAYLRQSYIDQGLDPDEEERKSDIALLDMLYGPSHKV